MLFGWCLFSPRWIFPKGIWERGLSMTHPHLMLSDRETVKLAFQYKHLMLVNPSNYLLWQKSGNRILVAVRSLWVNNAVFKLQQAWTGAPELPETDDKMVAVQADHGTANPACLSIARGGLLVQLSKVRASLLKRNWFRYTFIQHAACHGLHVMFCIIFTETN